MAKFGPMEKKRLTSQASPKLLMGPQPYQSPANYKSIVPSTTTMIQPEHKKKLLGPKTKYSTIVELKCNV